MSPNSKLFMGILLGVIVGATGVFLVLNPSLVDLIGLESDYRSLKRDNRDLALEVAYLKEDISELEQDKRSLSSNNLVLSSEKMVLENEKMSLEIENFELKEDYEFASDNWRSLSEYVLDFREELYSYCVLNESFKRVFNSEELDKIAEKIEDLTKGTGDDMWGALNIIHGYVRDDIEYVYDSEIPVISAYRYYGESDNPLLSEFTTDFRQNMYQDLDFTVEYEQGDCDDQAMLEYAMIKYYQRYILDAEYRLYLVRIIWEDSSHLAVFQPVQGENICILDPAGQYQTGSFQRLSQESVRRELNNYQDHWSDENGSIIELSFWIVDIDTGEYIESFSGSLEESINFFEA